MSRIKQMLNLQSDYKATVGWRQHWLCLEKCLKNKIKYWSLCARPAVAGRVTVLNTPPSPLLKDIWWNCRLKDYWNLTILIWRDLASIALSPSPWTLTDRQDFIKMDCLIYLREIGALLDSSGKVWTFPREEFFNLHW